MWHSGLWIFYLLLGTFLSSHSRTIIVFFSSMMSAVAWAWFPSVRGEILQILGACGNGGCDGSAGTGDRCSMVAFFALPCMVQCSAHHVWSWNSTVKITWYAKSNVKYLILKIKRKIWYRCTHYSIQGSVTRLTIFHQWVQRSRAVQHNCNFCL